MLARPVAFRGRFGAGAANAPRAAASKGRAIECRSATLGSSHVSTLRGLLDVRPDERRNTFAAFATLFAVTTGHTLLETARDALFLAKVPASRLPWMNLVIVACALALTRLGSRGARADSKGGVAVSLAAAAVVTSAFFAFVPAAGAPSRAVLYALYVWSGLFGSWVTVQFWTLLGRVHTMTQAKRLYGFIGAGAVLGAVIGAVLARFAMAVFAPRTTLLIAAGTFVAAIAPTLAVVVKDGEPAPAPDAKQARAPMTAGLGLLWENRFARRVLGIALVSVITVGVADYLFKSRIAAESTDPAKLGTYLSTFYAATNTLSLLAQLFVAPWLFRRQGVQRALFLFPAAMILAAASVLATGGALLAAVGVKLVDGSFRYSVHKTTMELLLVPVPDGTRERIKPITELLGTRGGQALASIAILLLVAVGAAVPSVLGAIVLVLAVAWLALVVTIRSLYLDVFRETLRAGGLSGKAELPELDLGALETIFAGLNSASDGTVLASLDLLADQRRERLIPALILYHPSREVVLRALEIFTQLGRSDFVPIADRLNGHPDREIAAAALRARTAVAPDREILVARLDDPCPEVAVTALVAAMAREWISEEEAARRVDAMGSKKSPSTAAEAARTICDVAPASADGKRRRFDDLFDDLLVTFAEKMAGPRDAAAAKDAAASSSERRDRFEWRPELAPELRVRLEVARAMASRKSPRFLKPLVTMLGRHELRAAAREALLAIPGALDALDAALGDPALPREVRRHVPRTISLFDPADASRRLVARLTTENDGAVRFKILHALVKLRRRDPGLSLDEAVLTRAADATIEHVTDLHRWSAALTTEHDAPPASTAADPFQAAHHLLVDLVRDKETHATQRLFLLLELLMREDFDDIWRGLRSKNARRRASSLELIENLVRPPMRQRVLALVGDGARPPSSLSYEDALREILARGGGTMRTLAEFRAAELGMDVAALRRSSPPNPLAEPGKRLLDRARDLLAPEAVVDPGATRAPA